MKWVSKLPIEIQNEILRDAVKIATKFCGDEICLYELVDNVMHEKLINIIGYENGMLSPIKYSKYLDM